MRHKTFSPRAAMLTLYGDYALNKSGNIGIGSLIELLGSFGLSANAVRSAVVRMCRSGLLQANRSSGKSYYSLTNEGRSLLTEGALRIFRRKKEKWDGFWNIVIYSIPERKRGSRDKLRTELGWLGYGPLSEATWISPYNQTKEVEELAGRLKIRECVQIFQSKHSGQTNPAQIVSKCWQLAKLHKEYSKFLADYEPKLNNHLSRLSGGEDIGPIECFVSSFKLIHEYRKLPFFDPDLPLELLPENWLRPKAAALFEEYHNLLADKANAYYDAVISKYETPSCQRRKSTIKPAKALARLGV